MDGNHLLRRQEVMEPMREKVWDEVQDHTSDEVHVFTDDLYVGTVLARRIYNRTVVRIAIAVRSVVYRSLLPRRPYLDPPRK